MIDLGIALCKCGTDLSEHAGVLDTWEDEGGSVSEDEHTFDAAGTRHRCTEQIDGYLCPRPRYHQEEGVDCGPLTGEKLWQ